MSFFTRVATRLPRLASPRPCAGRYELRITALEQKDSRKEGEESALQSE
jgi:hypothetical protein